MVRVMENWRDLCDKTLSELGRGPLGEGPPGVCHLRALLTSAFGAPVLVDAQLPAGVARLCWHVPAPFCATLRRQRFVPVSRAALSAVSLDAALSLEDQDHDPVMRDGIVALGAVVAGERRSRFVVRTLDDPVHRAYFEMMARLARGGFGAAPPWPVQVTLRSFGIAEVEM